MKNSNNFKKGDNNIFKFRNILFKIKMIDLHIHSKYSFDGSDELSKILKEAESLNLSYISITDHNNTDAYDELEKMNIKEFYSGKIIPGIEINSKAAGVPIEILGYNFDYKKMNENMKKIMISPEERTKVEFERLVENCKAYGIKLDDDIVDKFDYSEFASGYGHRNLKKYEENKEKLNERSWESSRDFYRDYMSNPDTPLFVEADDLVPDLETAINSVLDAGGIVFIPHIYEYRDNTPKVLECLLNTKNISGFECYYTTFTKEQHDYMINLCNEKNYYISGGSDYHGERKPDTFLGKGHGSLNIPEDIVIKWGKPIF